MTVRQHKRILAYVNDLREQLGKPPLAELPPGAQCSASRCPIAKALGEKDAHVGLRIRAGAVYVAPPEYVCAWIDRFDEGKYPELIA
jgi:hypothetical protein